MCACACVYVELIYESAPSVMVISVGNGSGDQSLNPQ